MAEIVIEDRERLTKVTLNGTVQRGDLLAHNGTNWVLADASDAATNLYAQFVALSDGASGDEIEVCKGCTIYEPDAGYTANATLYCSATGTVTNTITETRPTANGDVIQIVGRGIDTYKRRIDIKPPYEVEVFVPVSTYDTTGEQGLGVIDSPLWVGPGIDCTGEDAYFTSRFPSNVLSVAMARIVYNSIGETTITVSAALVACYDGDTNTGDTGTAHSAAAPTSLADNVLCYSDITAMFDADALKAGKNFTIAVTESGASAGDLQVLGMYMRYLCV